MFWAAVSYALLSCLGTFLLIAEYEILNYFESYICIWIYDSFLSSNKVRIHHKIIFGELPALGKPGQNFNGTFDVELFNFNPDFKIVC